MESEVPSHSPGSRPEGPLWAVSDLASFLNITEEGVRGMRKRGEIPEGCIVKIGRRIRFYPSEVYSWLGLSGVGTAAERKV